MHGAAGAQTGSRHSEASIRARPSRFPRRSPGRHVGVFVVIAASSVLGVVVAVAAWAQPFSGRQPTTAVDVFGIPILLNFTLPAGWYVACAVLVPLTGLAVIAGVERIADRRAEYAQSPRRMPLAPHALEQRFGSQSVGGVTILIPAHNEEVALPAVLESVSRQTARADRVVVIADNCTDGTEFVARRYGVMTVETVGNEHKKGGALNQVLAQLLPELGPDDLVLIMDADTVLSPEFLSTALDEFRRRPALVAVGGIFVGESRGGLIGQFQRNEFTRYRRELSRRRGRVFVLTGTATVFRVSALLTVAQSRGRLLPGIPGDVYDTSALTEDNELTLALKTLGGAMVSPDECEVVTEVMPTWRALLAQRLRWQRGALENLSMYGVTLSTFRYWMQQFASGYGVLALSGYFALMITVSVAFDTWIWVVFWTLSGAVFSVERVVTVWAEGWRGRLLALLVIPELLYDLLLDIIFVKGVLDIVVRRKAKWRHIGRDASIRSVAA